MKRKYFLLVLLLLSVNFWYLKPIGSFFASNYSLFVSLAFILGGGVYYYNKTRRPLLFWNAGYNKPLLWIVVGVFLSFIPAYINHGQSFATSFVACRVMLTYIVLPVLLIIRPSYKDIRWALYIFSYIYIIVALLDTYIASHVIEQIEGITYVEGRIYEKEDEGFLKFMEGIHYVGIALIFSLNRIRQKFTYRKAFTTALLLGIIFAIQNRSTLFPSIVFIGVTLLTLKNFKYNHIIKICISLVLAFAFFYTVDKWYDLLKETDTQLRDSDYNRNLAINYFLFGASPHWWENIIGNGFLSTKSTTLMQDMMKQGVFNSDVGFIGLWNQFGLLPVLVFGYILVKVAAKKKFSFLLKCNAWFIIACSLTSAYFVQDSKIPWACIFLYMFSAEDFFISRQQKIPHSHVQNGVAAKRVPQ